MNRQTPIHACYYSNKCPYSSNFIKELKATDYFNDFRFICVDPSINRPQLPSWLKKVPTIVISGENQPRVDGDVMNWISEMRIRTTNKNSQNLQNQKTITDPQEYISCEMGGFKDNYSFLDADTSSSGNGGHSIMHNFEYLNGQGSIGTRESASIPPSKGQGVSKKEEQLNAQYELYMQSRDAGMPKHLTRT
jgi:hypothetical protein